MFWQQKARRLISPAGFLITMYPMKRPLSYHQVAKYSLKRLLRLFI